MSKINVNKIVEAMKLASKVGKPKEPKGLFNPIIKPTHSEARERDMRQDAMDMGAHQAKEFFGDKAD